MLFRELAKARPELGGTSGYNGTVEGRLVTLAIGRACCCCGLLILMLTLVFCSCLIVLSVSLLSILAYRRVFAI